MGFLKTCKLHDDRIILLGLSVMDISITRKEFSG